MIPTKPWPVGRDPDFRLNRGLLMLLALDERFRAVMAMISWGLLVSVQREQEGVARVALCPHHRCSHWPCFAVVPASPDGVYEVSIDKSHYGRTEFLDAQRFNEETYPNFFFVDKR